MSDNKNELTSEEIHRFREMLKSEAEIRDLPEVMPFIKRVKNRADGGRFWGGIFFAFVLGFSAFMVGAKDIAKWILGER